METEKQPTCNLGYIISKMFEAETTKIIGSYTQTMLEDYASSTKTKIHLLIFLPSNIELTRAST